jgi:hypothetical protein
MILLRGVGAVAREMPHRGRDVGDRSGFTPLDQATDAPRGETAHAYEASCR